MPIVTRLHWAQRSNALVQGCEFMCVCVCLFVCLID